jgi:hypothetical protein
VSETLYMKPRRIVYILLYIVCVITKERSTLAADVRAERFLDFDARN